MTDMDANVNPSMKNTSSSSSSTSSASTRAAPQQTLRHLSLCSQIATAQHSSPVVFPEKRSRTKTSRRANGAVMSYGFGKVKTLEHAIEIGDEHSNLLGNEIFSGKLALDGVKAQKSGELPSSTNISNEEAVDSKLTSKALIWGSNVLPLADVISVSYNIGLRHFTLHSYALKKTSCRFFCFSRQKRSWKDFRFLAPSPEAAIQWVTGLADQRCFVNCLPHPLDSSKKHGPNAILTEAPPELYLRCKSPPKMLVILNPRSGRGRSSKVFHEYVEPIFKLAGFRMEVVKTASAGHARSLAYNADFSTCPDGIICVGGDGIVNEVLNGLLSRDNQKEAISIPIGIIPAGSDNSLVWTVLGVRDPISAALSIIKGGLTATDVFVVEWLQTGVIHFGMTVSYYGFVSDVLELSEKYQKTFGPLRYFVAGFLKFLCMRKYSFELEYIPVVVERGEKPLGEGDVIDMSELYTDVMGRSRVGDGIPRASSLSSIDSIMTPTRISSGADRTDSTNQILEPSEYVRAIDPKSKRLSTGKNDVEAEVIHPQVPPWTTPNWPRTRSKSRTDKRWAAVNDQSRCSWADKEDISSTMSDPGPIWDAEPKWDAELVNPIDLPFPSDAAVDSCEDRWVATKGQFLGILVCNHACRTVQSLRSQVVAPGAEHDDGCLDMLLIRGNSRWRLLRFFLLLQLGRHLSLPYVEYLKVKSVRIRPGKHTNSGCGIDGELLPMKGQIVSSLLPEQCRLIGRSPPAPPV